MLQADHRQEGLGTGETLSGSPPEPDEHSATRPEVRLQAERKAGQMLSDGLMIAKIENVTTSGHFEGFGQVGATAPTSAPC